MTRVVRVPCPTLESYWTQIRHIQPLPAAEEQRLARLARAGNRHAQEQLVCASLRFVVSVATQYAGRGLTLDELVSEGNEGLLEAAVRFDPDRGFKFITYAVWWIRQAILKALVQSNHALRQPQSRVADAEKLGQAAERLAQERGAWAPLEAVREVAGVTAERCANAHLARETDSSLDDDLFGDGRRTLGETMAGDASDAAQALEAARQQATLTRLLNRLDPRERTIVAACCGWDGGPPRTLEQIGGVIGLTRERVRQLRNRALERLRGWLAEEGIESFADVTL